MKLHPSRTRSLVERLLVVAFGGLTAASSTLALGADSRPIDFNRDIRPILSNTCYECHGPDEQKREGGLRLDEQTSALAELDSGATAVVAGKRDASELFRRITSEDEAERMPPPDAQKQLTPEQVELLGRWIDEGAVWRGHWSFSPPLRAELPGVKDVEWPENALDFFILSRLEAEGLRPSPPAEKETLIRRVTFDLTGLPPTPNEIDAFLADDSSDAYEKVVDRLLASRRFGEHVGRYWLDAARYGDTHGLHLDNEREIWPYRNWVIDAFNRNMPYDQFTVEQLAGDLLPSPTRDQLIATGFNRCNVTTSEGGSIDEEYYVRYAVDRVETMSTVFMGLTAGCAVCHDHKYDPITQKDFYRLFAFYGSLTERAMDGNAKDPPPVIKTPNADQERALAELASEIAAKRSELAAPNAEIDAAQLAWETAHGERLRNQWQVLAALSFTSQGGASHQNLDDGSVLVDGANPDKDAYEITAETTAAPIVAIRLEALTHDSLANTGPGRSPNSNFVLSEFEVETAPASDPTAWRSIKFVRATADHSQTQGGDYDISKAIDGVVDATNGWAVSGYEKHESRTAVFTPAEPIDCSQGAVLRVRLRHESHFQQHGIGRLRLAVSTDPATAPATLANWRMAGPFPAESRDAAHSTAFPPEQGVNLDDKYLDGALSWIEKSEFADGKAHALSGERAATYLHRTIHASSERTVTFSLGSDDGLKLWLNDELLHDKNAERAVKEDEDRVEATLQPGENRVLLKVVNGGGAHAFYFKLIDAGDDAGLKEVAPILTLADDQRSDEQRTQLRDFYRRRYSPEWKAAQDQLAALKTQEEQLNASIPTTMVMREMDERREAFVLIRGEYDKKGEKVEPDVPAALPPLAADESHDRLGLARWLVSPRHPLTARVAVNRFWQQFFGTGIVKTSEDFGSQGEWPSHPELLDWLAVEFRESGWDVKAMQKLIAMSAAYRQSSRVRPELLAVDSDNRLLARGPRFRLDAEVVRDNALAVSDLLIEGPVERGVKPYQPPGLWEAVGYVSSNTANFTRDDGDKLYRRSVYTFWKRTAPPPFFLIFDAPSRESCTVRRPVTNTPLQALVLLNDEQHVEAARRLARRVMLDGGATRDERLRFAFRLATARYPRGDEMDVLTKAYEGQLAEFQSDREAALALLAVGEAPRDESLDPTEHAAWTMVMNLILNLDETVTKG